MRNGEIEHYLKDSVMMQILVFNVNINVNVNGRMKILVIVSISEKRTYAVTKCLVKLVSFYIYDTAYCTYMKA